MAVSVLGHPRGIGNHFSFRNVLYLVGCEHGGGMSKKDLYTVKQVQKIVKKRQIEDKETKQKNRRGSINIQPPAIELDDFMVVASILKRVSGINKDCIR